MRSLFSIYHSRQCSYPGVNSGCTERYPIYFPLLLLSCDNKHNYPQYASWNMNCWTSIWHLFFTVKMNVSRNSHSMKTLFLVFRSITFSIIFNVALNVPFELPIDAWLVCTSSTQIDTMLTMISALNTEPHSRAPEYCSSKTVYCSHTKYND